MKFLRLIIPVLVLIIIFLYLLLSSTAFVDIAGIVAMILVAATLVYFVVSMKKNQ